MYFTKNVKICFTEDRYLNSSITGPSRHVKQLARELVNHGYEVTVFCEANPEQAGHSSDLHDTASENPRIVGFHKRGDGPLGTPSGLIEGLRNEHPDVIHAQGYRNATTDSAAVASVLNNIPFVLSPRGSLLGYTYRPATSLTPMAARCYDILTAKMTLRVAAAVVVTSSLEREEAIALGIDPNRIQLIPHGMEFPEIPRDDLGLRGNPKLLVVSRLTPHRNILDIVKSTQPISEEFPDAVLYVVGDPIPSSHDLTERKYYRLVSDLVNSPDFRRNVVLMGGVYGVDLWKIYSSCDLFVYASNYDNFGFGLLEAAYFGLPIVSTDAGIADDIIQGGKGGALLANHNPETIGQAVLQILRDSAEMKRMGLHNRTRANGYSLDRNLKAHIQLYEKIAESGSLG